MSASMISREDTLQTVEATEVSLMLASCSTFSSGTFRASQFWLLRPLPKILLK
jgi:hypothetical protein